MATELEGGGRRPETTAFNHCLAGENQEPGETKLLLQAFEKFTHASNSLESAFGQLRAHAQRLTEELEAKNVELEISLREKQEAQNYLRTILERLPCGVFVLDDKGDLALCNPMASEVLEQTRAKASSGKRKPFLSSEMRNFFLASASADATKADVEVPISRNNKKRILATSGAPLTNEAGNKIGTLHIIRDITEMKALQEQSKRVERLSAMGEMAVELAHEIRNPLASIELFASLLAKDLSGDLRRWAENIRVGIRSLNTIVSNMLHFAKPIPPTCSRVSIHEVIQEILNFVDPIMQQRDVRVESSLSAAEPVISGDQELLKQMMLNLIFNAMKAMPSQGSLIIRTRNVSSGTASEEPSCLELQVQDTGIGIPPENLNRIFDPFFTTNKNGTGLGLSVVHQIVERHSGSITVSSEVNRGTTFTIVFRTAKE
ncbi:MAG: ATP-binding protein [Acidobacteriota bacterium]|jgi:PAS domain S-box-containing protein